MFFVLFYFGVFKSKFLVSNQEQFLRCVNMFYSIKHLILDERYELYFIKIVIGGNRQVFFNFCIFHF